VRRKGGNWERVLPKRGRQSEQICDGRKKAEEGGKKGLHIEGKGIGGV